MMKHLFGVAAVLVLVSCPVRAQAPQYTTEVIGIQVGIKGFDYEEKWNRYGQMPFNLQRPGVAVAMALFAPQGGIIKFDQDNSTLTAMKDNKKTDLLAKPAKTRFGNEPGFGPFPKVSKDGKRVMFSITTPVLPAKGAQLLSARGQVGLLIGSKQKVVEAKNVKLAVGEKLALGPFSFEVVKVGKPSWGDAAVQVELKTNRKLDDIIEYSFHGPGAAVIESSEAGSSSMSMGSMITVTKEFAFKKKVTTPVTVRIKYWEDMRKVSVPFKAVVGLMPYVGK